MVSIIEFELKYADEFKNLNLEWLDKYGLTEEPDLLVLNDPQKQIIDTGGCIFLAKDGSRIVGSAALKKETTIQYELAKMCVAPDYRGTGISKLLIETCLHKAEVLGAKRLYLVSNSQLTTALSLYTKYGFKHIEVVDAHYITADVMMELLF